MIQYSIKNGNLADVQVNHNLYTERTAVMFKIVRLPKKIKPFFASLEDCFHWNCQGARKTSQYGRVENQPL
jgi:hypothetical protein